MAALRQTSCMSNVARWFERKFESPFPMELLPNLRVRLRGTPARLEETLRGVPHEVLTAKPNGGWSAQEHVGHLFDLEALWLARVEDFVAGSDHLTVADLSNRKTEEAHHNSQPLERILADFRAARRTLLHRVESLDALSFSHALPHPRLKTPMRLADHLYFVAEHDDHHLARMWELVDSAS
jgi:uncharacterized damage-inducible protein DinB